MKAFACLAICVSCTLLTACATDQQGVRVVTQRVEIPVPAPCAATAPVRPSPLAKPLPTDLSALVAALAAKLGAYELPGMYADQVDAYVRACPPTPSPTP